MVTNTPGRCIIPSLVTKRVHPNGWSLVQSTSPEQKISLLHLCNLKMVWRFSMWELSSLLQDTITGFCSWTCQTLIINLWGGSLLMLWWDKPLDSGCQTTGLGVPTQGSSGLLRNTKPNLNYTSKSSSTKTYTTYIVGRRSGAGYFGATAK